MDSMLFVYRSPGSSFFSVAECVSIPEQRGPEVTRGDGTETADKDGTLTRPAT